MNEILKRLADIKAEAEKLRDSDDPERLIKLRALRDERKELNVKLTEAQEEEAALEELTQEVPVAEEKEVVEETPEEEVEAEGDEEVEAEKPAEARTPALAAAASAKPVDTDIPEDHSSENIPLIASGNFAGTNPGDHLGVHEITRIHRQAGKTDPRNGTIKSIFATLHTGDNHGAMVSERQSAEANSALMASATVGGVKPITAAAAFCGPDDIVLDICAAGTDARPVQNLFRTVPVRGKFRYMKTATLADVAPGIGDGTGGVWEEADQIALDVDVSSTWKPCVDLTCRDETTVTPYAIPACTTIGVWQQLSAPEQIANWLTQMQKQYARVAETQLLNRIRAQSTVYTAGVAPQGLWTTIQPLLSNVVELTAAVNRGTTEGYVIVAPYGTLAALAADETMRAFSQNKGIAKIQAELRENYGMRIVEAYETDSTVAPSFRSGAVEVGGLPLGGAGQPWVSGTSSPDVWPLYVLHPDAFVAGMSDVVDAGFYRDGTLVRQNLVRYFWEGMEFLEKTCDHLSFVFELGNCPNGVTPSSEEAPACNAAI